MPHSHIHGSTRRCDYGLNLTDAPGNRHFPSAIRIRYGCTTANDYGHNTESYGHANTSYHTLYRILSVIRECVSEALLFIIL